MKLKLVPVLLARLDFISELQIINKCSLFKVMVTRILVMMMMTFLCLTRKEVTVVEMLYVLFSSFQILTFIVIIRQL